jgi:hypothetical protein
VATNVFELVGIYIKILSSLSHHDDDCNTGASTSTTRTTNLVLTNIDMADSTKETTVLRDLNWSRTKHQQVFSSINPHAESYLTCRRNPCPQFYSKFRAFFVAHSCKNQCHLSFAMTTIAKPAM